MHLVSGTEEIYISYLNSSKRINENKKLVNLCLSGNQRTSLPERIGDLTQLESLYLDRNQLKSLPERIGHLEQLKILNLRDNSLEKYGESGMLWQKELVDIFGNRVLLSQENLIQKYWVILTVGVILLYITIVLIGRKRTSDL